MSQLQEILQQLTEKYPLRVIISKPKMKSQPCRKIDIHRYPTGYQAERQVGKQMFHDNFPHDGLLEYLSARVPEEYRQINGFTTEQEWIISVTKKGEAFLTRKKLQAAVKVRETHNREKHYILREGETIPPLIDMGVFTKEGKIVASMQDKFRQINRFIEAVDDLISKTACTKLHVIDFGCGKGYLTFLLYYYLTEVKKISAHVVGIDLKADVMENCRKTAARYGYDGMEFLCQDIRTYQPDFTPDVIVSLHACDIATDFVLYHAIQWGARMIFSMPCCQHELNGQMQSEEFSILTRYGLLQERAAALYTDAIRANLLSYSGYRVQVMEIVNPVDTPKNIMLRAEKANIPHKSREKALQEVENLQNAFHLSNTLYRLLMEKSSEEEKVSS